MGTAVQVNTRLDTELKTRGDRALARAGFSPSQAIRALWQLASNHHNEPEVLRDLLNPPSEQVCDERARKAAAAHQGRHLCDGLREKLAARATNAIQTAGSAQTANVTAGVIDATSTAPAPSACTAAETLPSDRALLEEELFERLGERGLA